jgi:hypothetical protein
MKNSTIKSEYSFKSLWDVILLSLGLIFSIIFSAVRLGFGPETLSAFVWLIGFCFWWTHSLVSYFIFTPSSFTVVRYIMPAMNINYADVIDIGVSKIKTKFGDVSLAGIANVDEIICKFHDLIDQGKVNPNQLENKILPKERIWRKSILPSLIISLPFWVLLFYSWPFYKMWFTPLGLGLAAGLILFFVGSLVQWVVKKKLTKDKAG